MIVSASERDTLHASIAELESLASVMPAADATRQKIYRIAAQLRKTITKAAVTRTGRVDGHPC